MTEKKEDTKGLIAMGKFCELVGLSNQRVLDMIKDGTIKSYKVVNKKHLMNLWAVNEYISFLRASHKNQLSNRKPPDLEKSKLQAEVDYKTAKARVAEMQCDEMQGVMHNAEIVETVVNDFIYFVRDGLLSLPNRLAIDMNNALAEYFGDVKPSASVIADLLKTEINNILVYFSEYKYDNKKMTELTKEKFGKSILEEEPETEKESAGKN